MEFIIYSTSERMEEHSDWKDLEKEFTINKKQLSFVTKYGYKEAYFIEIKSIEELVKLCQYESIIIHNKGYKESNYIVYNISVKDRRNRFMTKKVIINKLKDLRINNLINNYENFKEWLYLNGTRLYNVSNIEKEREEDDYVVCQIGLVDGYGESFGFVQYSFFK